MARRASTATRRSSPARPTPICSSSGSPAPIGTTAIPAMQEQARHVWRDHHRSQGPGAGARRSRLCRAPLRPHQRGAGRASSAISRRAPSTTIKGRRTLVDFFRDIGRNGFGATVQDRLDWNEMRMDPTDLADVTGYDFLINGKGPKDNWTGHVRAWRASSPCASSTPRQ